MMLQMKVYLADDERFTRDGISQLIPWEELGLQLMGTGADGQAAFKDIASYVPDIVITDIKMPKMDGIELIQTVTSQYPHIKFVVLSGYGEFELASQAMRHGVKYYLLKPCDEQEIIDVLQKVIEEIKLERLQSKEAKRQDSLRAQLMQVKSVDEVHQLVHARWSQKDEEAESSKEFGTRKITSRMKQIIDQNVSDHTLSLQWLSQHYFYLHPEYLGKLFRKETKQRFNEYLNTKRIELARELLISFPDMKIYEIAERSGFGGNQQYFGNVFKKLVGCTPMEYRKMKLQ